MTLCTGQRTHLLMGCFPDIQTHGLISLNQSGSAYFQIHCGGIVTVGTSNGIHYFLSPVCPGFVVKFGNSHRVHQAGYVGAFAGPAGGRLRPFFRRHGSAGPQGMAHIFHGMHMSSWGTVIFREGISGPKDNHFRALFEDVSHAASVELTLKSGVGCFRPGLVFAGIIYGEQFIARFDSGDFNLFVVHHARNFCPALRHGCCQHSKEENHTHCHEKQEPAYPWLHPVVIPLPVHSVIIVYIEFSVRLFVLVRYILVLALWLLALIFSFRHSLPYPATSPAHCLPASVHVHLEWRRAICSVCEAHLCGSPNRLFRRYPSFLCNPCALYSQTRY